MDMTSELKVAIASTSRSAIQRWVLLGTAIVGLAGAVAFSYLLIESRQEDSVEHDGTVQRLPMEANDEQDHVRAVAEMTRQRVLDQVRPAMERTQKIATDPAVIEAMRSCDQSAVTLVANQLVRGSTEIDLVAVFDSRGTLCGFNSEDADGRAFPSAGIAELYSKSFADRPIINSCLRADISRPALEFQLHCDFTPALNNSVGLSVAYSVPVNDPQTGARLGVVSARLWFERLLAVLPTFRTNTAAVFVAENGEVFEESVNPRGSTFPIPPTVVQEMRAALDSSGQTQSLFLWKDLVVDLGLVRDDATIAEGALYVLSYADRAWVTSQARQDRGTLALTGGALSLLVLCGLCATCLFQQWRMSTQLAAARSASESANQAKSDFLAAMSHEIRTPMNGVIGMVDVLMQTSLRANQMDIARSIRFSADSLLTIVGDILDFSKIEAGKLELIPAPMCIEDVVEGSSSLFGSIMAKRHVHFTHFVDPEMPALVVGDANRLRQILVNLLSNAIKFSSGLERPGCISLRATMDGREADRDWVRVTITDNGIGMSDAVQSRLFQPFQQGVSGTTRSHGGTGLGLVISQRLANLMGGQISVASVPGEGSTFSLRLPFKRQAQPERAASLIAGASALVIGRNTQRLRDCLAHLRFAGVTASTAANLRTNRVADLLVWVVEPDDGLDMESIRQFIREYRSAHSECTTPFIVLTCAAQRTPPFRTSEMVQIDGAMTTRVAFLRELAVALGRLSPILEDEEATPSVLNPDRIRPREMRANKRILVAEDNETNQEVIRAQLDLLGFPNDIAEDGEAALEAWRKGNYCLVLSDLHLPKMDGMQLTAAIRAEEAASGRMRTPILALTANAVKGTDSACKSVGMDDYLTKPLLLSDLQVCLDRWTSAPTLTGDGSEVCVRVEALRELVGNDEKVIQRLLADYRARTPAIVQSIERTVAEGSWKAAADLGHKLKSSSRAVGAIRLASLCEQIEQAGSANDGARTSATLALLLTEHQAVNRYLAHLADTNPTGGA